MVFSKVWNLLTKGDKEAAKKMLSEATESEQRKFIKDMQRLKEGKHSGSEKKVYKKDEIQAPDIKEKKKIGDQKVYKNANVEKSGKLVSEEVSNVETPQRKEYNIRRRTGMKSTGWDAQDKVRLKRALKDTEHPDHKAALEYYHGMETLKKKRATDKKTKDIEKRLEDFRKAAKDGE
jgi:hypothetical protein